MIEERKEILEYIKGRKVLGSKYLQRLGSPGNYIYVYPGRKIVALGRNYKRAYSRFIQKNRTFLNKIQTRYDATHVDIMPGRKWTSALMKMTTKGGDTISFHLNLKTHGIKSYRSVDKGSGGVSAQLAKSKKNGVLRYR
jgi:hypothetical protein